MSIGTEAELYNDDADDKGYMLKDCDNKNILKMSLSNGHFHHYYNLVR